MKKLLNTLYVTTEGASLRKDGENVVAEVEGEERGRVPLHMLGAVVVFGGIFVTPPLMGALARAGITLVLLDRQGRFEARVEGPVSGNVLLRRAQYQASDQPDEIVRSIVSAKIANQRAVLQRALRDHGEEMPPARKAAVETTIERMERILRRVAMTNEGADACAARRVRPPTATSRCSAIWCARPTPRSCFEAAAAVHRSTRSTRCYPSSIRS